MRRGGGRLLRRIPVMGALLAGGGALASMFGMDDDPTKSAEENRTQRYRGTGEALGMGVGGVLGGLLGSVLGPAGTVAGALVGSLVGEKVGEKVGAAVGDWTKGLVDSDIPGMIAKGWNVFTAGLTASWESLTTDIQTAWGEITTKANEWWDITKDAAGKLTDKVSELAATANDWIKQKTGVDVRQSASNAWDSTKAWIGDKASQASLFVQDNAGKLVPNTIKRAAAAGAAAAAQAKAGYDEARGKPTTAPAPANALQSGARTAGNMAGNGINKIVETGAGYNVVQRNDGSVVRQDGARNWRNNNPGNIEWKEGGFAARHGAIGSDGRFAIFPSYEAGRAAKAALIFDGPNYKEKSLTDAIARYAPPSENNTAAYQRSVLAAVGGANKRMSEYTPAEREAIMDAMQKVEGYRAGKTTTVRRRHGGHSACVGAGAVAVGAYRRRLEYAAVGASEHPGAADGYRATGGGLRRWCWPRHGRRDDQERSEPERARSRHRARANRWDRIRLEQLHPSIENNIGGDVPTGARLAAKQLDPRKCQKGAHAGRENHREHRH